jgi:hypothetical protein
MNTTPYYVGAYFTRNAGITLRDISEITAKSDTAKAGEVIIAASKTDHCQIRAHQLRP